MPQIHEKARPSMKQKVWMLYFGLPTASCFVDIFENRTDCLMCKTAIGPMAEFPALTVVIEAETQAHRGYLCPRCAGTDGFQFKARDAIVRDLGLENVRTIKALVPFDTVEA